MTLHRRTLLGAAAALPWLAHTGKAQSSLENSVERAMPQRLSFHFADQRFAVTLHDNPTARDFLRLLPLDLTIEDYGSNEKIVYLPEKLTEAGAGPIDDPAPGDICYFAPWGNLALYHGGYSNYPRLIRLGKLDAGPAPLLTRGTHPVRIERIT